MRVSTRMIAFFNPIAFVIVLGLLALGGEEVRDAAVGQHLVVEDVHGGLHRGGSANAFVQ